MCKLNASKIRRFLVTEFIRVVGVKVNYFEAYKDIWNYHKKFIDGICDDDSYWQSVIDEGDILTKKYQECKFIRNLVLNEAEELERIYKEMKVNADRVL